MFISNRFVYGVILLVCSQTEQIQHSGPDKFGWLKTETRHFVIYHNQPKSLIVDVANMAEKTYSRVNTKWFAGKHPEWTRKCDIYVYASGKDYTYYTGIPSSSPGHTSLALRSITACINLHRESTEMINAVLPHEVTHAVLFGQFRQFLPRWSDEGIAVLSEPSEKIESHHRVLKRAVKNNDLYSLSDLFGLQDYPKQSKTAVFYAQSVCVVEFLVKEIGCTATISFIKDAQQDYNKAVNRHFEALERRWLDHLKCL